MAKSLRLVRRYAPKILSAAVLIGLVTPSLDLFALNSKRLATENISQAATSVMSEEQWLMSVYQKGKQHYDNGDYQAAVGEWDKLKGTVERYPAFQMMIDYLKGRAKNISEEQAGQVDQKLAERQQTIQSLFQKGKAFFDRGQYDQAIAQWEGLNAYLPEDAVERRLIEDFKIYYESSKRSKPVVASAPPTMSLEEAGEMRAFLESAGQAFKKRSEQTMSVAQSSDLEVENVLKSSYEKAKLQYYQGDYEGAIESLEQVSTYFVQSSPERRAIDKLVLAYRQSQGVQKEAEKAIAKKSLKFLPGEDFSNFLSEANEKMQAQIRESEAERAAAEASQSDRKAWALQDFQKGQALFEDGKVDEAIAEWEKVLPRLENETALRGMIEEVKKQQAELERSRQGASGALAEKRKAEMAALASAIEKVRQQSVDRVRTQQANIASERQKAEKALADKQAAFNTTFEKGRLLYEAGKYDEAKREWTSLTSATDDPQKIQSFIAEMDRLRTEAVKAQQDLQSSSNWTSAKFKAPAELEKVLQEISQKVAADAQKAQAEKAKADQVLSDRKALVQKTFSSGKMLYDSGKLDEALKEWTEMLPYLEEQSTLNVTLQGLSASRDRSLQAQLDAKDAESKQNSKLPTPEEFTKLISDTGAQLQTQIDTANARKVKAEQARVDKQAFVSAGFTKGRSFYDEGRFQEALKEWSAILPELEGAAELKAPFDRTMKAVEDLGLAQKAATDAEARKDSKLKTPMDIAKLLEDASAKLKAQTDASGERRRAAETYLTDRQNVLNNTFDKGKALYEEGKFSEAVKEWAAMSPELENGDKIKELMQALDNAYQNAVTAQKGAEEAEKKKDVRLSSPAELSKMLGDLGLKIKSQIDASATRKQAAEKALADRQAKLDAIYAKGKLAADQGQIPGAVIEWRELLPMVENEAALASSLDALSAAYENSVKAQQSAKDAEARRDSRIAAPEDLTKALSDISANSKAQAQLALDQKAKADQSLEDRKTLIRNTYVKGKAFFDEGRYLDALREWSSILGNLEEENRLKPLMLEAGQDAQTLAEAQKTAKDAEASKDQKVAAPAELAGFVQQASEKLKVQIVDAQNQKKKSEEYLAERQRQIADTVTKANSLFEDGRYDEAKTEWLSILPSMEDPAAVQGIVDELGKIHEQRRQLQGSIDEANRWKQTKFKAPSDISKELADSRGRIVEMTRQADVQKKEAEQYLASRQLKVQQIFDKGKDLYWQGKIGDAVQQWGSIEPELENSETRELIKSVVASYDALLKIQQGAEAAELKKESKLKTPEDLQKLLGDARQIIDSQTQYAETQKKLADQTYTDRQALINSSFQKGKVLYEQDRIPEALEEWKTITPYLEKGSQIKTYIDNVAKNYEDSILVKKAAEQAQVKQAVKFRAPEDLTHLLEEASMKLTAQVDDSKLQKAAAERLRADRQAFVDSTFLKGKSYYEQGRLAEAVNAWTALIPYIQDDAKIRQLVLKVEESRRALEEENRSIVPAPALAPKPAVPQDFEMLLKETDKRLEKTNTEKSRAKLEADVRQVIQNKKAKQQKISDRPVAANGPLPMDEIEQMMIEYNVSTPQEIERRHQELKAVK